MFGVGSVWWLEVEYEDISDSKVRPAIILEKTKDAIYFLVTTTTKAPGDPPSFYDKFKIPIINWRKIPLDQASYALSRRLIKLSESDLKNTIKENDYIGQMSLPDLQWLVTEIELRNRG
jgi:mRNA interferase MazF